MTEENRKIVTPGEVIAKGDDYLPGEGTEKIGDKIIALRLGVIEESNNLIKIIPISGVYIPRRGNVVVGKVTDITFNGWIIDIDSPISSFLPVMECPRYLNKNDLSEFLDIGDLVIAKIDSVKRKGVDLTIKLKGLGKIDKGLLIKINPSKVPRVIGKEGSMINLIKQETGCEITVGQNGYVWINGKNYEGELFAKKAILLVAEQALMNGLTDRIKEWFEGERK